ncbi:MAG: right-handed parallel beta-helix repeat-containing protein, partial [Cyanobacteria bacterium REEB65]|nr:right-handed parallel beta-helix repeat-containing protein [Cyanobacteria bacterium REEB65]
MILAPGAPGTVWTVRVQDRIAPVLARAQRGDTVRVLGRHVEQVDLPAGLSLVGLKDASIEAPQGPVVRILGPGTRIQGLSLAVTSHTPDPRHGVVELQSKGTAVVSVCLIRGGAIGISLSDTATATLSACVLVGQTQIGIDLQGHSQAHALDCLVRPARAAGSGGMAPEFGVAVADSARAQLLRVEIDHAKGFGIQFSGAASGSAQVCSVHWGLGAGIAVWDESSPTLQGNTSSDNRGPGIAYFDNSGGLAEDNQCRHDAFQGIVVHGHATPTLCDNELHQNGLSGI